MGEAHRFSAIKKVLYFSLNVAAIWAETLITASRYSSTNNQVGDGVSARGELQATLCGQHSTTLRSIFTIGGVRIHVKYCRELKLQGMPKGKHASCTPTVLPLGCRGVSCVPPIAARERAESPCRAGHDWDVGPHTVRAEKQLLMWKPKGFESGTGDDLRSR